MWSVDLNTFLVDTETCGFAGVPVTIQWQKDDGVVNLHHIWLEPVGDTMDLIEKFIDGRIVCHNMRFDFFHLSKIYNMFRWARQQGYVNAGQTPLQNQSPSFWSEAEWQSQFGPCLKPKAAICTQLQAYKGEYQSFLMDSKPVWVRRVPIGMVEPLRNHLEQRTDLPWILFAKRKDPDAPKWSSSVCHDLDGEIDPRFKDLKLSFSPSATLKHLAAFLCGHNVEHKFEDIAYAQMPAELGYAPFAKLLSSEERDWDYDGKKCWPALLEEHIAHWKDDKKAIEYAEDDIVMLDKVYRYHGSPEYDEDGIIACQIASVRLRGFAFNMDGVREQHRVSTKIVGLARLNVDSPKQVLGFVAQGLDSMEQMILADGCGQEVIDAIKEKYTFEKCQPCTCQDDEELEDTVTYVDGVCQRCEGRHEVGPNGNVCGTCNGAKKDSDGNKCADCGGVGQEEACLPVVDRVRHIELVRKHRKRVQLFDKLILAKRAYPDFNPIGTKSGRMSGSGGLNFQGIDNEDVVRSLFTLADPGLILSAGDYSSQELAIAATVMQDEELMTDMSSGKSLHGLFAAELFECSYEEIMVNKGEENSRYGRGKSAVFLTLYGGTFQTLAKKAGVSVEQAERAYNKMVQKYPQMGSTRKAITDRFSAIRQSADGKMEYRPILKPYIESVFGFRRYFHTEYQIQKMIWDVVRDLPPEWQKIKVKVQRDRKNPERLQTISGAISSALYGTCFSIQNQIIRAANNHVIQSTGRTLTVGMQAAVWDIQPQGIQDYVLWLMSIHDELAVVSEASTTTALKSRISDKVDEQRETVPLTQIEWFTDNDSWAEKSGGHNKTVFGWQEGDVVSV